MHKQLRLGMIVLVIVGIMGWGFGEERNKPMGVNIEEVKVQASGVPINLIVEENIDYTKVKATTIIPKEVLGNLDEEALFEVFPISNEVFARMEGKSYKAECTIPLEELRYVRVLYYGFDEEMHIGEIVVHQEIAQSVKEIFWKLYENQYPIWKMVLVDDYDADDEASMADNNTSGFNFRKISGSSTLSKHSRGLAIDINPLYNPYVKTVNGQLTYEPANSGDYIDRTQDFKGKIEKQDLCYDLFTEQGFEWGGNWRGIKDYQHFEK